MDTKDEYREFLENIIRLSRKKMRCYLKGVEFKENKKLNSYIMKMWKNEANYDKYNKLDD